MDLKDLRDLVDVMQGQLAAVTNVCAALAATHPNPNVVHTIMLATTVSANANREKGAAWEAYAEGVQMTLNVVRAALEGASSLKDKPDESAGTH